MKQHGSGFRRVAGPLVSVLVISLLVSCASPVSKPGDAGRKPKNAATAGTTKNPDNDPASAKGKSGSGTKASTSLAGSARASANVPLTKTFKADYSRKDLLYIQGFGDGRRTLVSWMVGRDTLKTQKSQNMDQLLSSMDIDRFKSMALAYGEERWHADFEAAGYEILSVDTESFGPRQEGVARNDWIIVVSLKEKGGEFNERVPFLPDGTLILSSMD